MNDAEILLVINSEYDGRLVAAVANTENLVFVVGVVGVAPFQVLRTAHGAIEFRIQQLGQLRSFAGLDGPGRITDTDRLRRFADHSLA